jgi:hypothetical protein
MARCAGRPEQVSLLLVVILAMLCGKTSLKSIARFGKAHRQELARRIPLPRGKAPSFSTLQRAEPSFVGACSGRKF